MASSRHSSPEDAQLFAEPGWHRFYMHRSVEDAERDRLTAIITERGGAVIDSDADVDVVLVEDANVADMDIIRGIYHHSQDAAKRKVVVEYTGWVDETIRIGKCYYTKLARKNLGGRRAGRRNDFTPEDDKHLIRYIATRIPYKQSGGRLGQNLYRRLETLALNDTSYSWVNSHPWQSWRERYKKNQKHFDAKISKYLENNETNPQSIESRQRTMGKRIYIDSDDDNDDERERMKEEEEEEEEEDEVQFVESVVREGKAGSSNHLTSSPGPDDDLYPPSTAGPSTARPRHERSPSASQALPFDHTQRTLVNPTPRSRRRVERRPHSLPNPHEAQRQRAAAQPLPRPRPRPTRKSGPAAGPPAGYSMAAPVLSAPAPSPAPASDLGPAQSDNTTPAPDPEPAPEPADSESSRRRDGSVAGRPARAPAPLQPVPNEDTIAASPQPSMDVQLSRAAVNAAASIPVQSSTPPAASAPTPVSPPTAAPAPTPVSAPTAAPASVQEPTPTSAPVPARPQREPSAPPAPRVLRPRAPSNPPPPLRARSARPAAGSSTTRTAPTPAVPAPVRSADLLAPSPPYRNTRSRSRSAEPIVRPPPGGKARRREKAVLDRVAEDESEPTNVPGEAKVEENGRNAALDVIELSFSDEDKPAPTVGASTREEAKARERDITSEVIDLSFEDVDIESAPMDVDVPASGALVSARTVGETQYEERDVEALLTAGDESLQTAGTSASGAGKRAWDLDAEPDADDLLIDQALRKRRRLRKGASLPAESDADSEDSARDEDAEDEGGESEDEDGDDEDNGDVDGEENDGEDMDVNVAGFEDASEEEQEEEEEEEEDSDDDGLAALLEKSRQITSGGSRSAAPTPTPTPRSSFPFSLASATLRSAPRPISSRRSAAARPRAGYATSSASSDNFPSPGTRAREVVDATVAEARRSPYKPPRGTKAFKVATAAD